MENHHNYIYIDKTRSAFLDDRSVFARNTRFKKTAANTHTKTYSIQGHGQKTIKWLRTRSCGEAKHKQRPGLHHSWLGIQWFRNICTLLLASCLCVCVCLWIPSRHVFTAVMTKTTLARESSEVACVFSPADAAVVHYRKDLLPRVEMNEPDPHKVNESCRVVVCRETTSSEWSSHPDGYLSRHLKLCPHFIGMLDLAKAREMKLLRILQKKMCVCVYVTDTLVWCWPGKKTRMRWLVLSQIEWTSKRKSWEIVNTNVWWELIMLIMFFSSNTNVSWFELAVGLI